MTPTPAAPRIGAWHAAGRGFRVFVPVVVVHAVVQAALVLSDPIPALRWGFALLVAASAVALLLAVWLTAGAATGLVTGRRDAWRAAVAHPVALVWILGVGIVAVAASLLTPWLLPVVLALGSFLLPPAAAGTPHVVRTALRTVGHSPIRAVLLVLVALVVAAVSVVAALLLGLFITGWLSAGILWLWLGLVATLLLCRYAAVTARAVPQSQSASTDS